MPLASSLRYFCPYRDFSLLRRFIVEALTLQIVAFCSSLLAFGSRVAVGRISVTSLKSTDEPRRCSSLFRASTRCFISRSTDFSYSDHECAVKKFSPLEKNCFIFGGENPVGILLPKQIQAAFQARKYDKEFQFLKQSTESLFVQQADASMIFLASQDKIFGTIFWHSLGLLLRFIPPNPL